MTKTLSDGIPGTLRDRLFVSAFSRLFVYTILFEDNEPDQALLALTEKDRVLTIAGAGCGVAALLAARPHTIDAIDSNRAHLALAALKVSASRRLQSYDELHALLARGCHSKPEEAVGRLTGDLPDTLAAFWRSRWKMFRKNFYVHGLLQRNLALMHRIWPISPEYLRQLATRPHEDRVQEVSDQLAHHLKRRSLAALINSPIALLGAGINYTQRQRNLDALGTNSVTAMIVDFAARAVCTNLDRNWIIWHVATGTFNDADPECLPPYLRRSFHERSLNSPTQVNYNHSSLGVRLALAPDAYWSRFCLSDVADWMNNDARQALFREIHRTAQPGARVICRTVENSTLVDELGMGDRFRLLEPESTRASTVECSCLYRRVNCYEVLK